MGPPLRGKKESHSPVGLARIPIGDDLEVINAYQMWDPWSPFEDNFQWVRYSRNSLQKLDGTETIQMCSPSDQEVALYLQNDIATDDWNLLDLLGDTEKGTSEMCYTSEAEYDTTAIIHKPHPIKLSSVDSVFGRVITSRAPRLAGGFHASESSAFTEISVDSPIPTLTARYNINFVMMFYRQLLRLVTLIYTAYQKCFYLLQHQI
ncbi:FANCD2 opposite strand protein-like [Chiloscyllium plagiosum]|uniref:FANCD2 opposite strand protein-like n=1 Tax=Chiloscyllium plagiosum TaxID=36176 RepID=UPI001CB86D2F|nr:FANCD2 opposite strand protein-like [Chiloscyllium plagiosum]